MMSSLLYRLSVFVLGWMGWLKCQPCFCLVSKQRHISTLHSPPPPGKRPHISPTFPQTLTPSRRLGRANSKIFWEISSPGPGGILGEPGTCFFCWTPDAPCHFDPWPLSFLTPGHFAFLSRGHFVFFGLLVTLLFFVDPWNFHTNKKKLLLDRYQKWWNAFSIFIFWKLRWISKKGRVWKTYLLSHMMMLGVVKFWGVRNFASLVLRLQMLPERSWWTPNSGKLQGRSWQTSGVVEIPSSSLSSMAF